VAPGARVHRRRAPGGDELLRALVGGREPALEQAGGDPRAAQRVLVTELVAAAGADDGDRPAGRVEVLASLAGPTRLSELGVPEEDLRAVAADAAQRGGNLANPKPATPEEIEQLLHEVF